jgi:hypothetical protein
VAVYDANSIPGLKNVLIGAYAFDVMQVLIIARIVHCIVSCS